MFDFLKLLCGALVGLFRSSARYLGDEPPTLNVRFSNSASTRTMTENYGTAGIDATALFERLCSKPLVKLVRGAPAISRPCQWRRGGGVLSAAAEAFTSSRERWFWPCGGMPAAGVWLHAVGWRDIVSFLPWTGRSQDRIGWCVHSCASL